MMHQMAEKLMRFKLTQNEHQVLWMLFRFCYGYHNSSCRLRWSDMVKYTELPKGSLSRAIKGLEAKNIIKGFGSETKSGITYKINSKLSTWKGGVSVAKQFRQRNKSVSVAKLKGFGSETTPIKDNIKEYVKDKRKYIKESSKKIIDRINELKGSKYRDTKFIEARLSDGATLEDCLLIIENKYHDPFFQQNPKFFRPSTLFRKSHFDDYLNDTPHYTQQKPVTRSQRNIQAARNVINEIDREETNSRITDPNRLIAKTRN